MPSIGFDDLLRDMLAAAATAAQGRWGRVSDSLKPQLTELSRLAVEIEMRRAQGDIDEEETASLLRIREQTLRAVAAGVEAQSRLVAEAAVNAALGVLRAALGVTTPRII